MRSTTIGSLGALALAATLSLSACGSSSTSNDAAGQSPSMTMPMTSSSMPMTSSSSMPDAAMNTFGPGCKLIPSSGAGSFNGMATDPVATAASNNPLLTTLVTAVKKAGLVDTLNSAQGITVFAPTNDAFKKIPAATLNKVLGDKKLLTTILTHHVVPGQLTPDQLDGTHKTLAGDMLKISGMQPNYKVSSENAKILCGNIPTANATVYVVDTVLMPGK